MPRPIDGLIAQGDELADQLEASEPSPKTRGEPPLMAARRLAYQRSLLERELLAAVSAARPAGLAWSKIGHELGTSGEAARQRSPTGLKSPADHGREDSISYRVDLPDEVSVYVGCRPASSDGAHVGQRGSPSTTPYW
jgi:hypothetical protein